ncbi:MAG: C4-type zinc ribbon domain-containing protein, partial [Actinomycetota bacterium]|nr:C4-type zinc ribbon domain-containing protein [Actinomycetota bacterium]
SEQEANLYNGEVTAIKDLQAIQSDIAGLQERKRLVEDQILESMEQLEPLKVLWESILEEEQAISEQQNQTKTTLETNESNFDKQIEGTQKERSELAADIPEDLLQIYEKLRSRSGNIGVAQLTGRTCKGCHLDLPAVEVDRLKKLPPDELINCEECGCILVR